MFGSGSSEQDVLTGSHDWFMLIYEYGMVFKHCEQRGAISSTFQCSSRMVFLDTRKIQRRSRSIISTSNWTTTVALRHLVLDVMFEMGLCGFWVKLAQAHAGNDSLRLGEKRSGSCAVFSSAPHVLAHTFSVD